VRWYKKAAEQKNIESLYALGIIYDSGDGVEKDEAKSLAYYREAADLGHAQAQHNLATYYFSRADKEPSSRELMFKYYTLAAKQMHARSMMALGVSYFVMETSPNKVEGLAWMMAAVQCFAYKMDLVDKFRDQESPEDVAKARERATQIISQLMKQK
jgi:TPR repeat protein